jgi:threonine/homoserine/homoserine lactone efflux protein
MDTAATYLLRGILIGFSIAAPVGPIGVLCIRRTLIQGRLVGFISGLGAASADAVYGSIAALGLTVISTLLIEQQTLLRLVGGAFLCYLGVRTFLAKPAGSPAAPAVNDPARSEQTHWVGLAGAYGSTFFLTLTNPLTILSFAAIFAGLGIAASGQTPLAALLLVLGVFSGSALWWFLLSTVADALRARFLTPGALGWVNRISGLIITGFGILALTSLMT